MDRIVNDHDQVVVVKEKVDKLERLVYGALGASVVSLIGVVVEYFIFRSA